MSFSLDQVVPWGRSFDEYVAMFGLAPADFGRRMLGCGDGPAAFNTVANKRGGGVVSVDPLYACSLADIEKRIEETFPVVLAETDRNREEFVWGHVKNIEELGELRMSAMKQFLADYEAGTKEYRYVDGALPSLPFMDQTFELALCSHFLFLYSEQFDLEFHIESINELARVAEEVRIFPLNEMGARPSRHLKQVVDECMQLKLNPEIVQVDYEFQRGANRYLRLRAG